MAAAIFPLRTIDVQETVGSSAGNIVFSVPASWEFHTISHRWSDVVNSWAAIIERLYTSRAVKESYDDLIQRENFSRHEFYPSFMEFLELLRADGVKHVWLDSLCINQASESGEKSRELQNMGSYYAKSLGCYVCAHGFGEGFETWKEKETSLVMPSWFNRVWTFQEILLPKKVTFILYIHPIIRKTINWSILKQKPDGINGPCRCAMSMPQLPHPRLLNDDEELEEGEEEELEIICGDSPCSKCGGAALIRKARDRRLLSRGSAEPYFIEKECIVQLMIMAKEQLENTVWKTADEDDEPKLIRLQTIMLNEEELVIDGAWDPIQVVVEVSRRACFSPEDRVLAIIGLLGVEAAVKFTPGKTLDVQLLRLAQQLRSCNPTTLITLCMAQFAGHSTAGMSWAPSLEGLRPTGEQTPNVTWRQLRKDKHLYARQMDVEKGSESGLLQLGRVMRHFTKTVEVETVLDNGSLIFSHAHVFCDCWFVRQQEDENLFHLQFKLGTSTFRYPFQAYFSPSSCLLHYRVFIGGQTGTLANQSMVRLQGTQLNGRLKDFPVFLVLLGQLHLPNNENHEVLMVCVGEKPNSLHKVGIAWLPGLEGLRSNIPPSRCIMGGFEDYMDRFVFKLSNHQ